MCVVLTEAQVEGTAILEAVSVEGVVLKADVLKGAATGLEVPTVPETMEEVYYDALPESSMDVIVRSPEIQDAEPIRLAPMSEAAATSGRGLELLAHDLVDPPVVARNLESM
jgi:hypothetical protein